MNTLRELQFPDPCEDSAWRIGRLGGALTLDLRSGCSRGPGRLGYSGGSDLADARSERSRGRRLQLQSHWNRSAWRRASLAAFVLSLGLLAAAGAEEPAEAPVVPRPVELDRLLKLPAPTQVSRERIGNASQNEWRSRFTSARLEHAAAQTALDAAQLKMGEAATETESWQIAPPGAAVTGASDAPVNYPLRQEIRRQREELARSERSLQELTIEADLAGVPGSWRE